MKQAEFAFPGPLRDQLVSAILTGAKTSTSSLLIEYQLTGEELSKVGERHVVVDSAGHGVAIIETSEVRQLLLSEIDLQHAVDEGEGYSSVAEWRRGHEEYWHSWEMRDYLNDPGFTVNDATIVIAERFRLLERI